MIKQSGIAKNITVEDMKKELKTIQERAGLSTALETLYSWSLEKGYISRDKLEDNEVQTLYSLDYDVTFSYQVNYARAKYSAKPGAKNPLPDGASCVICKENAGATGKEDLRVLDFELGEGHSFFAQLTPFPLYPRHFVIINKKHTPMNMGYEALQQGLAFIDQAPSYTLCSNSDLPWAGASILSHSHFQAFHRLSLPIMQAEVSRVFEKTESYTLSQIHFPMATLLLEGSDREALAKRGAQIIKGWKEVDLGKTTVNLVFSKSEDVYRCYLILRHSDHRNPEDLQKYKSEGIGVVEAAGCWIFPPPQGDLKDSLAKKNREIIAGFFEGITAFDPEDIKKFDFIK